MKLNTLRDLYLDELRDLYDAEIRLTKAIPDMVKAATSPKLKTAFENHLKQTQGHVKRLETVFHSMDTAPRRKTCKAMQGLVAEASELIHEDADPEVLDAGLIAAGNRVEHYEMAGYGTVRTYARMLGLKDAERLLQETLDEEGEADKILTNLAETSINLQATAASGKH